MQILEEVGFLSDEVAVVASGALARIRRATTTLAVVDAGLCSVALVDALRQGENHEQAQLHRLLLIFETAVETRLRALR